MLSRVAEQIYWMSRFVERAENIARLVRVNSLMLLEMPKGISIGWRPLITITGQDAAFDQCCQNETERNVIKFLLGDLRNQGSVLYSLHMARENCRTVREIVPRSYWEKLNELYFFAKDNVNQGLSKRGRDEYLDDLLAYSQQLSGQVATVMYRDAAWEFMRIGRNIERADMTSRIIDVQSIDLEGEDEELFESRTLESLRWISILRTLSSHHIYRRLVQVRMDRCGVLELLMDSQDHPRSFRHCLEAVGHSVAELRNHEESLRQIHAVLAMLDGEDFSLISQNDLHLLIDRLQIGVYDIHDALSRQYFLSAQSA